MIKAIALLGCLALLPAFSGAQEEQQEPDGEEEAEEASSPQPAAPARRAGPAYRPGARKAAPSSDSRPPRMTDEEKIEWFCSQPANAEPNCPTRAAAMLPYISDYAKYPDLDTRGERLEQPGPCDFTGGCSEASGLRPSPAPRPPASGASSVPAGSAVAAIKGCPAASGVVGPSRGYDRINNTRFDLPPGAIGVNTFEFPGGFRGGQVRISVVGSTNRETPPGTHTLIVVSRCPGALDAPAGCRSHGSAYSNLTVGTGTKCPLEPGAWFINVAHRVMENPRKVSCTNKFGLGYCTTWLKAD